MGREKDRVCYSEVLTTVFLLKTTDWIHACLLLACKSIGLYKMKSNSKESSFSKGNLKESYKVK